ncbi:hypothetical protein J4E85_000988 [Alternaria conjuncta]|uniref:uncharacterized protein n=1 Tax=Alternaria conjuncta TaxID=181017 RepID=UPI0022204FCC|nr:uncharacterized protein J4E85_000988 [Alternaria conjuncta]KAI4938547.1 hypothetical protein J4E85_000988 [Alternaria conjuncta]
MEAVGQSLHAKMRTLSSKRQNTTPIRQRVQWTLYEERQLKELIKDIAELVNDLVKLYPVALEEQRRLCKMEVSEIKSRDALLALKDIAAFQDKELEKAIVEALQAEERDVQ